MGSSLGANLTFLPAFGDNIAFTFFTGDEGGAIFFLVLSSTGISGGLGLISFKVIPRYPTIFPDLSRSSSGSWNF